MSSRTFRSAIARPHETSVVLPAIESTLALIKQYAHGIKKQSVSIWDRNGIPLNQAQDQAAKRIGFDGWHELSVVAKRNPVDRRFQRASRLLKQEVYPQFKSLDAHCVESLFPLNKGSIGGEGKTRPVQYENLAGRVVSAIDDEHRITLHLKTPWASTKFPAIEKSLVIQKSGHTAESLAFEIRHAGSAMLINHHFESFVSCHHARLGDEVVFYDHEGYRGGAVDGTIGVIVGYEYGIHAPSKHELKEGDAAGFYKSARDMVVQWEDGKQSTVSPFVIGHADQAQSKSIDKLRRGSKESRDLELGTFVAPLPERKLFRGDTVSFTCEKNGAKVTDVLEITDFHYRWDDETMQGHVECSLEDPHDPHRYCGSEKESELCLWERGNEHYWVKGPRSMMKFDSLEKEIAFYTMVGAIQQTTNPRTGNYAWTFKELKAAVMDGRSLVGKMTGGMFGSTPFMTAYEIPPGLPRLARQTRERIMQEDGDANAEAEDQIAATPRPAG